MLDIVNQQPRDALTFLVSNDVLRCDPAEGDDNKYIEVEYSYGDGPVLKAIRRQGARIVLPEDQQSIERVIADQDKKRRSEVENLSKLLSEEQKATDKNFLLYDNEVREKQRALARERDAVTQRDKAFEKVTELENKLLNLEREAIRNNAQLLIEYRPNVPSGPRERLAFINDGSVTLNNTALGPLVWGGLLRREINLLSVVGPLRAQQHVECNIAVYEQVAGNKIISELPDMLRDVMRQVGTDAPAVVRVT